MDYGQSLSSRFFFADTHGEINRCFRNLSSSPDPQQIKAGVENLNKYYGAQLTLFTVAESGVFGNTFKDVADALLYDVFAYLDTQAAKDKFIKRLNEQK